MKHEHVAQSLFFKYLLYIKYEGSAVCGITDVGRLDDYASEDLHLSCVVLVPRGQ